MVVVVVMLVAITIDNGVDDGGNGDDDDDAGDCGAQARTTVAFFTLWVRFMPFIALSTITAFTPRNARFSVHVASNAQAFVHSSEDALSSHVVRASLMALAFTRPGHCHN